MNPVRILMLSHTRIPFIRQDEALLRKHFEVEALALAPYRSRATALKSYLRVLRWLFHHGRQGDLLFVRFADVYAFFMALAARLFR
ncbi:MAG: hypothetical protein GWO19_12995, partial [Nitrospinaceae bacterium]|nr:hypothetical protein [Nitrospinaceae bacterium]NIR55364.1 hypothetical protein [Nitrospinaceae bacterium]NIS85804.1 hypothetical protein [Nitrospinaceae bacterium]NIU44858.1 hypothetical protein [Nitrospinaceae bacterium]